MEMLHPSFNCSSQPTRSHHPPNADIRHLGPVALRSNEGYKTSLGHVREEPWIRKILDGGYKEWSSCEKGWRKGTMDLEDGKGRIG